MFAFAGTVLYAPAASAAFPQFWTSAAKTKLLRSVTAVPKNQPDAIQFDNEGPIVIGISSAEEPILCNEVEIGTTVVVNNGELETKLALPFGVAEGDNCHQRIPGAEIEVPTYFDTTPAGVVPANITVTPPNIATLHKLKLSHDKKGVFCTSSLEGAKGPILNVAEGFVEESPPNLKLTLEGPTTVTCAGVKTAGFFIGHFFLETMSTTTDTAFLE
jgi:hypothetical protein